MIIFHILVLLWLQGNEQLASGRFIKFPGSLEHLLLNEFLRWTKEPQRFWNRNALPLSTFRGRHTGYSLVCLNNFHLFERWRMRAEWNEIELYGYFIFLATWWRSCSFKHCMKPLVPTFLLDKIRCFTWCGKYYSESDKAFLY